MRPDQTPVGWWQDAKGRMQPPGSFLAPSLRVPSESPSALAGASLTTPRGRLKKWTRAVLQRQPQG
jgi:hypothetical protein